MDYDVDAGILVDADGRFFYGNKVVMFLSRVSTRGGVISKANPLLFRYGLISIHFYTLMRMGCEGARFVLSRSRLINKNDYSDNITVFSFFFGVFCFLHFLVYAYQFGYPLYFSSYIIPVVGLGLVIRPESRHFLVLVFALLLIDGVLHAPVYSNHTILKNFLVFAALLSFIYAWIKGSGEAGFYLSFSAVGRCLLLIMYFFGVFHKINEDFLNPEVSCAVALWEAMPYYVPNLQGDFFAYFKSYGALIIESVIFFFLLGRRYRNLGVVLGVSFHSMLALSGYALYAPFSMLTVSLHTLFLSQNDAGHVVSSGRWKEMFSFLRGPLGRVFFMLAVFLVWWLAYYRQYSSVGLVIIVLMVVPYGAIFSLKRDLESMGGGRFFIVRPLAFNLIPIFFLLNCFSPYLGIKTSQSMNMFANLRLEGGESNHYIMGVPGPFSYLERIVKIEEGGSGPFLEYLHQEGLGLVYYEFISYMEKNRNLPVSYSLNGERFSIAGYTGLPEQDRAALHPRWVRAWMHFNPVDLNTPKVCALDR